MIRRSELNTISHQSHGEALTLPKHTHSSEFESKTLAIQKKVLLLQF